MDDDTREDDDATNVLARVLENRLRDAFARFCADIPQILRSMPKGPASDGTSDDGADFVRALLEWIAGGTSRRAQAGRYLLMWYAKSIADQGTHKLPDGPAVVELLRARLTRPELADVDLALRASWDALRYGGSLKTLASRHRKTFIASLSPEQRARFARYLTAFLPPIALLAPIAGAAEAGTGVAREPHAPAGSAAPAWSASALIAIALPVVAGLAWYAVRGREARAHRAPPTAAPERHDRASAATAATAAPAATLVSTVAAEPLAAADPRSRDPGVPRGATRFAWTRQVSGVGARLNGVAWSGSRAVIVGRQGTLLASDDAGTWTAVADEPTSHEYQDVAYGNGVFVAVGTNRNGTDLGRLSAVSADGVEWLASARPEAASLHRVAFGSGVFVAIGSASTVLRSVDGEAWQPVTLAADEPLSSVESIDGELWIIGQRGTIFRSKDGSTWTTRHHEFRLAWSSMARGNGVYLVAGCPQPEGRASVVWRSSDGESWDRRRLDDIGELWAAAAGNGLLAVGGAGIHTSTDGAAWTVELPEATTHTIVDMIWTGSMMIAVGAEGGVFTGVPVL